MEPNVQVCFFWGLISQLLQVIYSTLLNIHITAHMSIVKLVADFLKSPTELLLFSTEEESR